MRVTINGKRYDTSKCEVLCEIEHRDYEGNLSGTTRLIRASNGQLLEWCESNGRDLNIRDYVCAWRKSERTIDEFTMTDEQEARCAKLGLIAVID